MRRLLTGLLGASLLLGACGDDGDDDRAAATSIPDETSSTTTTTAKPRVPPPDVIPTDTSLITEEYVEQVLDALYEVSLEAIVLAREEGTVGAASIGLLEATTSSDELPQRLNDLFELTASGFPGIVSDPKPIDYSVVDIREATEGCVVAEVVADVSGITGIKEDNGSAREFARLVPASPDQRATGRNPTAWVVDAMPVTIDGSEPELRCQ